MLVAAYGRPIRNLRSITNGTANREPKWRHKGRELTTGYRPTTYEGIRPKHESRNPKGAPSRGRCLPFGLRASNRGFPPKEPDVEALLVNRAGSARDHFRVGIDQCYRLAGLLRT